MSKKKKERKKIALGSRDRFFKNHFFKNGKLADTHSKDNCKLNWTADTALQSLQYLKENITGEKSPLSLMLCF